MALLTVALVASLAASTLWQQWRALEVEGAQRARLQSQWVLTGALDWARLILREDGRSSSVDYLGEPWSVPLAESRLSTFLAADSGAAVDTEGDLSQVFLSGDISDLHARLNLYNLIDAGQASAPDLAAFTKLFAQLELPSSELVLLTQGLKQALDATSNANVAAPFALMPQRLGQVGWLGVSPTNLALLRPYVCLLPGRTTVNPNTASAIVLYAAIPGLDMAQAQSLVQARQLRYFRTLAEVAQAAGMPAAALSNGALSLRSSYFEVHGRLRQDQTVIDEYSVVQRDPQSVHTLWRSRGQRFVPAGTGEAPSTIPAQSPA